MLSVAENGYWEKHTKWCADVNPDNFSLVRRSVSTQWSIAKVHVTNTERFMVDGMLQKQGRHAQLLQATICSRACNMDMSHTRHCLGQSIADYLAVAGRGG